MTKLDRSVLQFIGRSCISHIVISKKPHEVLPKVYDQDWATVLGFGHFNIEKEPSMQPATVEVANKIQAVPTKKWYINSILPNNYLIPRENAGVVLDLFKYMGPKCWRYWI
jgi:hypothetical protein